MPAATAVSEEWRTLAETIDRLENPVFAIEKTGRVIAWNKAMEQLTGVMAPAMIGKGNYEYAVPFYGERRPMLVDYIVMPADKKQAGKAPP